MGRTVGIGHQNFEKVRMKNIFYVDKTDFIRQWWESEDEVTLITRPRRFGKTLNMSMVEQFFSVEYAGRGELFQGLSIWEREEYRQLQGTYPVISLSFARIKEAGYAETLERMNEILADLYGRYSFLLEEECLSEEEKKEFRRISWDMSPVTAASAIHRLCGCLSRYYGKKVLILLDEYDTPMQEAYVKGYWEEMSEFMRRLFNSTFKTNPYLERALMTGITRVSKESIFSDFNNPEIVTTTSEKYETCFGFTEEEVFAALDEYGMREKKGEVKKWYDGFTFGRKTDIYNPWSIIHYLNKGKVDTYWANTSSNSLAGKLIREGSRSIKQDFQQLLRGDSIRTEIDEQIVYRALSGSQDAIWSLLLASGYLRISGEAVREKREMDAEYGEYDWEEEQLAEPVYEVKLTNLEVRAMFRKMVRDWFQSNGASSSYSDFVKALLLGDEKAMNTYMNRVALNTFSYFDAGNKPSEAEPERFYHGFVLGLMVELSGRYVLTSNRESGFGRYDVMLEPRKEGDDAILLEFKVRDPEDEETLEETAAAALAQIREKQYAAALQAKGIPEERIRSYGFAFEGKTVLIRGARP